MDNISTDGHNLKTGDLVLVRNFKTDIWRLSIFYRKFGRQPFLYECLNGEVFEQCIPYDKNKELAGTAKRCVNDCYIPQPYEHVQFKYGNTLYTNGVVVGFNNTGDLPVYDVIYSSHCKNETEFRSELFKVNSVIPITNTDDK